MTNKNEILNELKELGSKLPVAPLENIFTVPGGYFEGFASQVLSRIKAIEAADAKEELNHLSPYLKSLSKENLYEVPAGYFEGLAEKMMNTVRASSDYQTTDEELESLSPLLNSLKKETPYSVPQGYFENFSVPVVEETNTKVVSITNRKWFRLAAAAVVIGMVAITGVILVKNKTLTMGDPIVKAEKAINKSSTEELTDFIQNTTTETDIAVVEKKQSDAELNDLLKDIPDDELNQFVKEIVEPETEANESILN